MNESNRGYKVAVALLAAALIVAIGVALQRGSGTNSDEQARQLSRLASDLEDCKKIRTDYKDRIAQLEADLKRLQEQANAPNVVNGGTITAAVKGMDGGPSLPMDTVQKIIRSNTGGLKSCYERALKRDTGLQL